MQDETWRLVIRWVFLVAMIAITIGTTAGVYLLIHIHRSHERTIDLLIAWGRDRTGHLSESIDAKKSNDTSSTMGCDPTLLLTVAPLVFTRMSKMVRG